MKLYRMIQLGGASWLGWQYDFTQPSHKMAIDYASAIARSVKRDLDLFYIHMDEDILLAHIKVDTVTTSTVEEPQDA
jgi:hypothetical protein